MSGAYNRWKRSEVVIRLTENEAQRLEQRLATMNDFNIVYAKVQKARKRVQGKWQRYREMPIEPMRAERQRHLASCLFENGRWFCAADCPHHVIVDVEAERAAKASS